MAGLVHITTPYSGLPSHLNEVWIQGGRHGWLLAADLKEIAAQGHVTTFPGTERTISVLHVGPCTYAELAEL
jgi:hypothetical protein